MYSSIIVTGLSKAAIASLSICNDASGRMFPQLHQECDLNVCLHQAKSGLFIERNWIVTKSFAEK